MHHRILLLMFIAVLLGPQQFLARGDEEHQRELRKREEALQRASGPIGKVKALIKISEVHLRAAARSVKGGRFEDSDRFLGYYSESIAKALKTIQASGRNAQKNPAGFKDFEISLRKQLRKLDDLKSQYAFDQAQVVQEAIRDARSAQEEMLKEIFGAENTRKIRGQPKEAEDPEGVK